MDRLAYKLAILTMGLALFFAFSACTASGEQEDISPTAPDSASGGRGGNSSAVENSSANDDPGSSSSQKEMDAVDSAIAAVIFYNVPATTIKKGGVSYSVDKFLVSTTEVTQGLYSKLMGNMPTQSNNGDDFPIENVNWFQAALFCNEFSKRAGYDTAYVYTSVGENSSLANLTIDYSVAAMRLPTEMEWEIAAHAGTSTTYYWGTAEASKYAYYGQSKGPARVAQFVPNDYNLYDMAGNVAEWVDDWYANYASTSMSNPTGPENGSYRVVRGGGWSDPIKDCAPDTRDKKDPKYKSSTVGFRIVYSEGF